MKGPIPYVGGKSRFVSTILPMLPPHLTYVEPFSGGAQIFFQKQPSKVEVLNDLDGELVNFYRVCQSHHEELIRYMRFLVVSREWFTRLQHTPPSSLTDIQRAARYFYLQKNSFGGRVANQSYARRVVISASFSAARLAGQIARAHERLDRVQVEQVPYEQVIEKYDRPETFFYIDPPYYNVTGLYRFEFTHEQFEHLASQLSQIKGRFLLSINDHPAIRAMFAAFQISTVSVPYTLQKHAGRKYQELLIKNY
ncbi:MAG: DNA adenine methylase [Acidobacteriota bacterium]